MKSIFVRSIQNKERPIKRSYYRRVLSFVYIISIILAIVLFLISQHSSVVNGGQNISGPLHAGQSENWKLVFDDEFNGTSLDTTKWVSCFRWGDSAGCGSTSTPQNWYLPGNVAVSNGILKLTARNQPVVENGITYPYTSAMITTGPLDSTQSPAKFAFTYGYVEIRAKVPKGQGLWPALWALPIDNNWPAEIDGSEILSGAGLTTYTNTMTYHYKDVTTNTMQSSGTDWTSPVDLASGFHVYAVDWEPDGIHWYVDGFERRSAFIDSKNITAKQMYLLVQLQVGGSWPGSPDSRTPFPSDYEVDYVRVWQHCTANCPTPIPYPTSIPTLTPTPGNAPAPNLIYNPGCETNTVGWAGYNAVLSVNKTVSHSGNASCNVTRTTGSSYELVDNPDTVINPQLGQQYTATAYVRSSTTIGKPVCLAIKLSGGTKPTKTIYSSMSINLSKLWQQLILTVSVDDPDRTSLKVYLIQESAATGDSFQADDISLQVYDPSP